MITRMFSERVGRGNESELEENKVMMRWARGLYVFELMQKTGGGVGHRTGRKKRTGRSPRKGLWSVVGVCLHGRVV